MRKNVKNVTPCLQVVNGEIKKILLVDILTQTVCESLWKL